MREGPRQAGSQPPPAPEEVASILLSMEAAAPRPDGSVVARIDGEWDISSELEIVKWVTELLREPPSKLVLDLRGLSFIDSSGLRALIGIQRRTIARDTGLEIVYGKGQVERVFSTVRLESFMSVRLVEDREQI